MSLGYRPRLRRIRQAQGAETLSERGVNRPRIPPMVPPSASPVQVYCARRRYACQLHRCGSMSLPTPLRESQAIAARAVRIDDNSRPVRPAMEAPTATPLRMRCQLFFDVAASRSPLFGRRSGCRTVVTAAGASRCARVCASGSARRSVAEIHRFPGSFSIR